MKKAEEAILSALAYYDAFDVPLTAQEIFLALPALGGSRLAFEDLEAALADLLSRAALGTAEGFYFLPGSAGHVETRKARYVLAEGKYKKVRKFLAWARCAPYLRAVFVCNTLARSNARAESDIDVFLVAAPGRAWIVRACVAGLAALLGVRPDVRASADRVCLSFFVTADALELRALAIEDDVYLAHWLHELYPVYDEGDFTRQAFAANAWLREILPETLPQVPSSRRALALSGLRVKRGFERACDGVFGSRLEGWAKRAQLALMPPALRAAAATPATDVVLSDAVLKFHDRDRRAEIRDAYQKKREEVLNGHAPRVPHAGDRRTPKAPALAAGRNDWDPGRSLYRECGTEARAEDMVQEKHARSLA